MKIQDIPEGVSHFTILHLLGNLTVFLTPFYCANVCLLFVNKKITSL